MIPIFVRSSICKSCYSPPYFFSDSQSKKKIRVREIVSINHRGTKRKYLLRDPLFTEKLGGSNVGKGSSGNIFTRVIDRPPVESPGRTCNSVAHACPVSRCFARASTHAMSRCHGLTQLTRVATSPSLSLSLFTFEPSRSSPLGPNRRTRVYSSRERLERRETVAVHLLLPPRSTSSLNHHRFHRFDGRIWLGETGGGVGRRINRKMRWRILGTRV